MSGGIREMFRRLLLGSGAGRTSRHHLNELRSRLSSEQEIRQVIVEKGQIQAIKEFRQQTGAYLKESKEAVEDMAQEMEEGSPPSSSRER